jgi:hypothetical protein
VPCVCTSSNWGGAGEGGARQDSEDARWVDSRSASSFTCAWAGQAGRQAGQGSERAVVVCTQQMSAAVVDSTQRNSAPYR